MGGGLMVSLPAFNLWNTCSSSIISDICFETVTLKHLASDDNLFHNGTDAKGAFLVISGRLNYTRTPEVSIVDTYEEQIVEEDTWLCEAALWTYWVHTGACEAQSTSRVALIQATLLGSLVHRHRHLRELAVAYAYTFHKKLLQCSCHESAITDLVVPGTGLEDVIETLDNDVRRVMGE